MPTLFINSSWYQQYSTLISLANNPKLRATSFSPGPEEAYKTQLSYWCLDQVEWLEVLLSNPKLHAAYMKASTVAGVALHSSNFTDGMVLKTMHPTVTLTLAKKPM